MSIAGKWGRKLGLAHHLTSRTAHWFGVYATFAHVPWSRIGRIIYVCEGNICRSAYGAARARAVGLDAQSFGLRAATGIPADPVAIETAVRRGIDLNNHRSAAIGAYQPAAGDLLLAMEPAQARELTQRFGGAIPVSLLGLWTRPLRPHIEDPFGLTPAYFETCFTIIDAGTQRIRDFVSPPSAGTVR
jgi:protein-tyrosine phosphatase